MNPKSTSNLYDFNSVIFTDIKKSYIVQRVINGGFLWQGWKMRNYSGWCKHPILVKKNPVFLYELNSIYIFFWFILDCGLIFLEVIGSCWKLVSEKFGISHSKSVCQIWLKVIWSCLKLVSVCSVFDAINLIFKI